ncbi:MAG: hypothetical protein HY293_11845, partial [Planctomycetes bacterium]|nr:hypothetical protein [Planctomycetota bacterium]
MTRVAALILILFAQQNEETIVLNHARLLTVSGEAVEGPLIVVGGKISRIGGDLPPGATVVDLAGKIVIPGLIDAGCTLGVAGPANEDGEEVAPQVRIVDSLDPRGVDLARARQSGVTAAFVEPGNRGVIGGVASLIRTSGRSRADMILRPEAALKAAIGPAPSQGNFPPRGGAASFFSRRPTTRMGVAWEFRKAFFDARKYADDHREEDPGKEVLLRAL